jgi:hypothetical protein
VEFRPEVPFVLLAAATACTRKRLTGATSCPNWKVVWNAGEPEGERPARDPGEEMALSVSAEIPRFDIENAPFVHDAGGDVPSPDQFPEPRRGLRVVLVVIGDGHP